MNIKFSPNLFLEVAELERFKDSLDKNGFRKNILENSVKFGFIKSNFDLTFDNAKATVGLDAGFNISSPTVNGEINIPKIRAIDKSGRFIYGNNIKKKFSGFPNNAWYWIRCEYAMSNDELGTVTLSPNGNLTGTGTEFTKILRGNPNFPSKIKLVDANFNTLEYEVLEVIDDTHAVLTHPATNTFGNTVFGNDVSKKFKVVGTFTDGVVIADSDKFPFEYDAVKIDFIPETVFNTKPAYTDGYQFYIARVKLTGASNINHYQDKRLDYWETKGSQLFVDLDQDENPVAGVESIRWGHEDFDTADKNQVDIAWGIRSSSYSIAPLLNRLNVFGAGGGNPVLGGRYKNANAFTTGDFDGWRLYTKNGNYARIVSSVKSGTTIQLFLDVLDVDDYSNDGGNTYNFDEILVVPNCEEVEIIAQMNTLDGMGYTEEKFTFPVNTPVARIDLLVYKDPFVLYNLKYRNKNHKDYSPAYVFQDDNTGYFTEVSFDANGNLLPFTNQVLYPYNSDITNGYIKLNLAPWSYHNIISNLDLGDLNGVNVITNLNSINVHYLHVGQSKNYQYVSGTQTLTQDIFFSLQTADAVEGNEFRIHIKTNNHLLNGNGIYLVQDYNGGFYTLIKLIGNGDIYEMQNQDGGICFTLKYTGSQWIFYQNYDLGTPYEIVQLDGVVGSLFNVTTGLGIVKGTFGKVLCDTVRTVNGILCPNLAGRFLMGYGAYTQAGIGYSTFYTVGATGGEAFHVLTTGELASHSHGFTQSSHTHGISQTPHNHGVPQTPHAHTSTGTFAVPNSGWQLTVSPGSTVNLPQPNQLTSFNNANINSPTQDANANISVNAATITASIDNNGSNTPHENRSPYYACLFAKKIY